MVKVACPGRPRVRWPGLARRVAAARRRERPRGQACACERRAWDGEEERGAAEPWVWLGFGRPPGVRAGKEAVGGVEGSGRCAVAVGGVVWAPCVRCGVGGIVVSIAAFQAVDPGSIPGQRNVPTFCQDPGPRGDQSGNSERQLSQG